MTVKDLIDKYTRRWNDLNDRYSAARRLRHAATNPIEKLEYEADQDAFASAKVQVENFIADLHALEGGQT